MLRRTAGLTAAGIVALAVSAVLTGCTLAPVDPEYALEGQGNAGVVFLSLTRSGSVEPSMWLKLRGIGHKYSAFVAVDDQRVARDWAKLTYSGAVNDFGRATQEQPVGHLAAFSLPAGDYEFYAWYGASPMWQQPGDDYNITSQNFSVKFTVRPGQVAYAGNLNVSVPDRIIADHRKGSFEIAVADRLERDQALLRQKYPRLAGLSVATRVMNSPNAGQSLTYFTVPTSGRTRNGNGSFP